MAELSITETVLQSGAVGTYDSDGTDFDILRDAVVTAGLAGALDDDTAEFTVFAPVDAAFVGLAQTLSYSGSDEAGSLSYIVDALTLLGGGDPLPLLTDILTYHVVPGEFALADVVALGDGAAVPTLLGATLTTDFDTTPASLIDADDGIANPGIIATDIPAENGIIHALNGVLLPISVTDILAQPGTDFVIGDGDNEHFSTGWGKDFVDGNGGRDIIRVGSGDDVAFGGDGNDFISGQRGNDILLGEAGRDTILGGRGNDTINGGEGCDRLIGGWGNDVFVFENGSDHDKVIGFQNGRDKIDLSGYAGIDDFSDIADDIDRGWFGSKINLDHGDSIFLVGVRPYQLDESDFIFAGDVVA